MSHTLCNLQNLELSPLSLILTPNHRISDAVLDELLNRRLENSIPAHNVLSLAGWLNQVLTPPAGLSLASETQLQMIWEDTIENMNLGIDMHPPTLAPLALKGWRHLKQWQVPLERLVQAEYGQDIQFNRWCSDFEKRLAKFDLSTIEHIAETLITGSDLDKRQNIILVDFLEPPAPLWQALLEAHSNQIDNLSFMSANGVISQHQADDAEQETLAAARHVADFLKANPDAQIGLVATQDSQPLREVEHALWLHGVDTGARTSLGTEGVIQAALRLLKLNLTTVELADARAIIQSPFFGDYPEDIEERGIWERRTCSLQTRSLKRSDFLYCLRESPDISTLRERMRKTGKELAPIEWADVFQQQLNLLGWPGKRPLSERQAAAFEQWPELLGDLAALGQTHAKINVAQAIKILTQLAQQRNFQSNPTAKVQLLDRIEAAANFDLLWVFGCDDEHWPGSPSPQPLLPLSLQLKYGMPRCSSERELELSRKLLGSLQHRAQHVVCSFARTTGDQSRNLTPLLQGLENLVVNAHEVGAAPPEFEFIDCSTAPPLTPDQKQVRGGARLMQLMAASPFDAFAEYRLNAYSLEYPYEGVSPAQTGQLVHDLMDRFWTELRTRDNLAQLTQPQLEEQVDTLVDATLRQWSGSNRVGNRQMQLLSNQLGTLLRNWVPMELQRDDFRVTDTEQELALKIADIELRLRIDRIDQAEDGLLLIDYKSGSTGGVEDWRSLPPVEPQLPLYCIALGSKVAAIAFAKLKLGEAKWVALGQKALVPRTKIDEEWENLITNWREGLTTLAEDFARGDARVRETSSGFFQEEDPLKRLHRFNEFDELEKWQANT